MKQLIASGSTLKRRSISRDRFGFGAGAAPDPPRSSQAGSSVGNCETSHQPLLGKYGFLLLPGRCEFDQNLERVSVLMKSKLCSIYLFCRISLRLTGFHLIAKCSNGRLQTPQI